MTLPVLLEGTYMTTVSVHMLDRVYRAAIGALVPADEPTDQPERVA